jgi:hypothetical protein
MAERDGACPHDVQLRSLAARSAGLPVNEQPHLMRELCGESVKLERGEEAQRAVGMPLRDFGKRGLLGQIRIGDAIEATSNTLDRSAVGEPPKVGPGDLLLIEIASSNWARFRELEHNADLGWALFAMRFKRSGGPKCRLFHRPTDEKYHSSGEEFKALNRKNSRFVGNERGGETSAVLSSLTSSCRRNGVDPQVYLTQLLMNLLAIGNDREKLKEWLPDRRKRREAERERPQDGSGDR